jgi:hypothetical protein
VINFCGSNSTHIFNSCAYVTRIYLAVSPHWYNYSVGRPLASSDLRFFSLLHFRQYLSSDLHFRQFNGSKTRIVDKVEMRNLSVLIELAAKNWFQPRQRIGSSHKMDRLRRVVVAGCSCGGWRWMPLEF